MTITNDALANKSSDHSGWAPYEELKVIVLEVKICGVSETVPLPKTYFQQAAKIFYVKSYM